MDKDAGVAAKADLFGLAAGDEFQVAVGISILFAFMQGMGQYLTLTFALTLISPAY